MGVITGRRLLFLEMPGTSTGGFLDQTVARLGQDNEVRYLVTTDAVEIEAAVRWAELVWLEFANQMAVQVTNKLLTMRWNKVVCRVIGYEVFTDEPAGVDWRVVDHVIFLARHKQEIFNSKVNLDPDLQSVIYCGVDTEKFHIAPEKKNTKRIALVGHLNFRKGLLMLLQFYHELLKRDPAFHLLVRGDFQDARLMMAAETMIEELHLGEKLEVVGRVPDLNAWLADKSHVLSFSIEESFGYTIGEGMAAGCKPVIHAWKESRDIWPGEYIFNDLDGFLRLVLDETYEPEVYRKRLFEKGLTADRQFEQVSDLIGRLF